MNDTAPPRERLDAIQCLRGLAALMVVADHLMERLIKNGLLSQDMFRWAWALGDTGVFSFFAISGFIIVYSNRAQPGPASAANFLKRRFVRIVPMYYLCTLGYIVMSMAAKKGLPDWPHVLASLLFLPLARPDGATAVTASAPNAYVLFRPVYELGWTLNYEMLFYALIAVTVVIGLSLRRTTFVLVAIMGIAATAGLFLRLPAGHNLGFDMIIYYTRMIVLFFATGVIAAFIRLRVPALARRLDTWPMVSAIAVALAVIADVMASAMMASPYPVLLLATFILIVLASSPTLMAASHSHVLGAVRTVGDASYSIYLTHSFFLGAVAFVAARLPVPAVVAVPAAFAGAFAVSIGVGMLCYAFIERPLLRRLS